MIEEQEEYWYVSYDEKNDDINLSEDSIVIKEFHDEFTQLKLFSTKEKN